MAISIVTAAKRAVKDLDCEKIQTLLVLLDRKWRFDSVDMRQPAENRIPAKEEIRVIAYDLVLDALSDHIATQKPVFRGRHDLYVHIDGRAVSLSFSVLWSHGHTNS
jgi:hypothetical protein